MNRRRVALLAACLCVLAGCAGEPPAAAPGRNLPGPGTKPVEGASASPGGHHGRGGPGSGRKPHHRPPGHGSDRTGADGGSDAASGDDGSSGGEGGGSGRAHAPATAAIYPAAGDYVYAQSGTEQFCDPTGNCDEQDLPPTQRVESGFERRGRSDALVVQEAHMSDGRYVRTKLHFTPEAAFVTDVYYKLVYRGFNITEEYAPDPPVPSVRFPLSEGKQWDATWSADTSGDYHARVAALEQVDVNGKAVDAYRIETLTHFRGEYDGKASVVLWFDVQSKTIVRTNGALSLKASYGSYSTTFETTLKSAPGY